MASFFVIIFIELVAKSSFYVTFAIRVKGLTIRYGTGKADTDVSEHRAQQCEAVHVGGVPEGRVQPDSGAVSGDGHALGRGCADPAADR